MIVLFFCFVKGFNTVTTIFQRVCSVGRICEKIRIV